MGWRRLAGLGIAAVAATVAAGFLLLPLVVGAFVESVRLSVNAAVWLAASLGSGADAGTLALTVGRAVAAALMTSRVLAVVAGLILVGAVALYGLQRLLGYEEESSR
jgi:hypothetical protein